MKLFSQQNKKLKHKKEIFYLMHNQKSQWINNIHCIPLIWCSVHKYKYWWDVGDKVWISNLYKYKLHTHSLKLDYNRNSIIYPKKKTIVSGHWKDHWKNMRGGEKFGWESMLRQTCWWIKAKTNQIYENWFV